MFVVEKFLQMEDGSLSNRSSRRYGVIARANVEPISFKPLCINRINVSLLFPPQYFVLLLHSSIFSAAASYEAYVSFNRRMQ